MIARGAVVVAAVVAIVVLAGQLRIVRDVHHAERLAGSPAGAAESQALLEKAAADTSDTRPEVREVQLLLFSGKPVEALTVAQRVVRAEPDNAEAWLLVAKAADAAGSQKAVARAARARVAALVAMPAP